MDVEAPVNPSRYERTVPEPTTPTLKCIWDEAVAGLFQRPGRSMMTALGAVLGIGSFVAVLGVTATANAQITERFNSLVATQVEVRQSNQSTMHAAFPDDAEERLDRLNGVRHSSVLWDLDSATVSLLPPGLADGQSLDEDRAPVMAASRGLWSVAGAHLTEGRTFDTLPAGLRTAVIGETLARTMGVVDISGQRLIYINDVPFSVIGIVRSTTRLSGPETSVVIPADVALREFGPPVRPPKMVIETDLGAAASVAREAPLALDQFSPGRFTAVPPVDPSTLQENISSSLRTLFLFLAGICLFIGVIGIINANLVAVLDRTPEIGLRRSLGAMPRHVAGQFLIESGLLGLMGGLTGTCLSIASIIGLAWARDWTPVIDPTLTVIAPLAGCLVGLVAGSYPAYRASRIDPVEAFRK